MLTDTATGSSLQRIARRVVVRRTPDAVGGEPGLFVVDATGLPPAPLQGNGADAPGR